MLKTSLILAALLAVTATASDAFAQRGNSGEQRACSGDVRRLCRSAMSNGDGAVLSCLQQNRRRLSSTCRRVLQENGQ